MVELSSLRCFSAEQEWTNKYGTPDSEAQIITILEHYNIILEIATYNLFSVLKDYLFHRNNVTKEQIKMRKDVVTDIKMKIKLIEEKKSHI